MDGEHFHEFNALVVELTGSETLVLLANMLEHILQAAITVDGRAPRDGDDLRRKAFRQHQRLIDHIRGGEVDEAEHLWRRFLLEAGDAVSKETGAKVVDLFS
jgi:DNA-binding GntR family transcriptional regulator